MELRFLKDDELETSFHRAIKTERKIMHIVLLHIQEIERRKLYLSRKCDSIHKYLTSIMRYSSSSANRRIHAAILVTAIPSIALKIESGEINLTQIGELQRAVKNAEKIHQEKVTTEQKAELVERIINLSTADSQQVCAEALNIPVIEAQSVKVQKDKSRRVAFSFSERQFAKFEEIRGMLAHKNFQAMRTQDIPDVLETLFDDWKAQQLPKSKSQNRKSISKKKCKAGEVFATTINANVSTDRSADESSKEPVTPTQCETGTAKLNSADLETGDIAHFIKAERPLEASEKDEPHRGSLVKTEDQTVPSPLVEAESESLDKAKWHTLTPKRKKLILQRDQCCQYIDDQSNEVCGSIFNLHVDHIQPKWADGKNNPGNLRVLCQQHNLYRYSH